MQMQGATPLPDPSVRHPCTHTDALHAGRPRLPIRPAHAADAVGGRVATGPLPPAGRGHAAGRADASALRLGLQNVNCFGTTKCKMSKKIIGVFSFI